MALVVAVLLGWAWSNRFVQDDAFISFRYARNLSEGRGLTWNAGERIEGYTNFMWVLLMALPIRLGLDPVLAAYALGLACYAGSLLLSYALARELCGSRWQALLVPLLIGLNHTFSSYATGGLETQLQACALSGAALLTVRVIQRGERGVARQLLGVSLCASAGLLTRLDSAVVLAPLYLALVGWLLKTRRGREAWQWAAAAVLPALAIVGGWLHWKLQYYGDVLPNTYYAKASSPALSQGLAYVYRFVTFYWLGPVLVLGVLRAFRSLPRSGESRATSGASAKAPTNVLWWLGACVVLWLVYVVAVGGDFMEFRFFVPVLPLGMVLAVWLVLQESWHATVRAALVLALALGGVMASWGHKGYGGVESIAQLQGHLSNANENWVGVGQALGERFGGTEKPGVLIATTAAGAIPYYSGLDTVDMLGLNDAWVARYGRSAGARTGHQKLAPYDYLVERGVNLVIGHPRVAPEGQEQSSYTISDLEWFTLSPIEGAEVPVTARVLEVPLEQGYALRVLYLVPHPRVEQAIAQGTVSAYPVVR
ncbi:MAG: hypothetical protein GX557_09240 [Chloroflexi bacterium]|nr:hypothetical protein [Chloroflexota bacterium]